MGGSLRQFLKHVDFLGWSLVGATGISDEISKARKRRTLRMTLRVVPADLAKRPLALKANREEWIVETVLQQWRSARVHKFF